jgi:hypothetical protein
MSQELIMEQDKIKSLTERVRAYVLSHVNLVFELSATYATHVVAIFVSNLCGTS